MALHSVCSHSCRTKGWLAACRLESQLGRVGYRLDALPGVYPLFLLTLHPLNCPVTCVGGHIATHDSTSTYLAALEVQPLFFGAWVLNGRMAEQLEILKQWRRTVLQMNTHNAIMNQNMYAHERVCICWCICRGAETSVGGANQSIFNVQLTLHGAYLAVLQSVPPSQEWVSCQLW